MNKKLVIVESPSKEKYIKKYLGASYDVKASYGHIADLPKKELGVDIEKNFKPKYIVTNRKALRGLKDAFKGKNTLILAVDPDREGEAIGWHVAQRLGVIDKTYKVKKGKSLQRIVFTEITKDALQKAITNPRNIDINLVNAQQTRRILDRLVGYKLSPVLWKKIRYGLSAGRVQSVALKIIVDREREIKEFKPQQYWQIIAYLGNDKTSLKNIEIVKDGDELKKLDKNEIKFFLIKIKDKKAKLEEEKKVKKILKFVLNQDWIINEIKKTKRSIKPYAPFKTSTLQQDASNKLGFTPKKTMMVAQKLYENGLITYMRTDSISLSNQAIDAIRKFIRNKYSDNYLPEKPIFYKTKSKVAQEAHECIRPTNFNKEPNKLNLSKDESRLYELIFNRAVASQMKEAIVLKQQIFINVDKYLFESQGQKIVFDGFLKILKSAQQFEDMINLDLKEKQKLFLHSIYGLQKFTKPKPRYKEASLVKILEKLGVGRPSTYASIISTLLTRKYVIKDKKFLVPTDVGIMVTKLLEENFPDVVDYKFTARLEDLLDEIANGKKDWIEVLKNFYDPFEDNLNKKTKEISRKDYTILGNAPSDIKCPKCGGNMIIKLSKFGKFYSCAKWPDCDGMVAIKSDSDTDLDVDDKKFFEIYKRPPKTDDGRNYVLKNGRFGQFWAHPDYPKIKDAKSLEFKDSIKRKIYGRPPKAKDGLQMVLRSGRYGEFWAHPDYPKIKEVKRIKKQEVDKRKKEILQILK